jgi:hypothetical protein
MEDFHKALKTGSQLERHHLQTIEAIWRLLTILTPLVSNPASGPSLPKRFRRWTPFQQKRRRLVIHLDRRHQTILTAKELWRAIARLGGYLDRKSDGPQDGKPYGKDGCVL